MIDDYCMNTGQYSEAEQKERLARVCGICNHVLGDHSASRLFCPADTSGRSFNSSSKFVRKPDAMVLTADSQAL